MDDKQLYFIAILPTKTISERITVLKNNFAKEYNSVHALKLQPHITLQRPFRRSPAAEVEMHLSLQKFFENFSPIVIQLKGFGCFKKKNNKVIFIEVEKNELLNEMQRRLIQHLISELKFSEQECSGAFHPHITVGYRDLSEDYFKKAWSALEGEPWEENFNMKSAYLFKHNFRQWELLSEFPLGKNKALTGK